MLETKKGKSQLVVQGAFIPWPYTLLVEIVNLSQIDSDNHPTCSLVIDLPVQPIKPWRYGKWRSMKRKLWPLFIGLTWRLGLTCSLPYDLLFLSSGRTVENYTVLGLSALHYSVCRVGFVWHGIVTYSLLYCAWFETQNRLVWLFFGKHINVYSIYQLRSSRLLRIKFCE